MIDLFLRKIKRIYSNSYELVVNSGTDKVWWAHSLQEWVSSENVKKTGGCSHKHCVNKYEAFKEFDEFTENGICCVLITIKWRFNKRTFVEYHSDEQDYFNIKNR